MSKKTEKKASPEKEKKKRQSPRRVISNNVFLLKKIWKYTPGYLIAMVVTGVTWGLGGFISVYFTKVVFDRLGTGAPVMEVLTPVIIWAAYYAVFHLLREWHSHYYSAKLNYMLNYKINAELFEKAQTLDLACYDDPEFYNDFVWAMNESGSRATELANDINRFVNTLIGSASAVAILFTINKWLALTIIGFTAVRWIAQRIQFKLYHKRREALNPLTRRRDYYARVFYMEEYAKELRMTDVADTVLEDYGSNSDNIKNTFGKFGKRLFGADQSSSMLGILCDAAVMLLMVYELMVTHNIELGGFAAGINATWQLSWRIRVLTNILIKFPEHSLYTEKVRTFLDTTPKILSGDVEASGFEELKIQNVSFNYRGSPDKTGGKSSDKDDETEKADETPDALKNIDMTVRRGEKIAFVGYNGAGKTTLIKLLMRLYDPTEGTITYNGRDLREYKLDGYRKKIGALFQDYKTFAATLAENVLGDLYDESKSERVLNALHNADFDEKLAELPDGLLTNLTKEYDDKGVVLSGGEQQKVAISRVFSDDHDILIMDEPSSALDPDAEYRLNNSILDYAKDKTVIFISHRLSTTRMADRIYMFEDGRIIEQGTHDELMAKNGKYAYMFNLQAEKYQ